MNRINSRVAAIFILASVSLSTLNPVIANPKPYGITHPLQSFVQEAIKLGENKFIIELNDLPLLERIETSNPFPFWQEYQKASINSTQNTFRKFLTQARFPNHITFSYKNVLNGFCIEVDPLFLSEIKKNPMVKRIYGINKFYLHREFSIPAVSAEKVWDLKDSNGNPITGKGTLVGVIDTGIDYWHPDLGGGLGKKPDGTNYKVIGGYDFSEMNPIPFDPSFNPHGTHVAGIIAGIGEAGIAVGHPVSKGVAPEASLISYKVFTSKSKSTGSDALLYALEQAITDKCTVINLSLGRDYGWTEDPLAIACDRTAKAGVIVVASAGNDGARDTNYNLFPISTPSTGKETISCASSDETVKLGFSYKAGLKNLKIIGRRLKNSPPLPMDKDYEIINVPGTGSISDFSKVDANGKVVLVKRGDVSFQEKNDNAKKAGAVAMVVYNYTSGLFSGVLDSKETNLPTLAIDKEAGENLIKQAEKEKPSIKFQDFPSLSTMSSFTSEGPTPELNLKPDLTAPGSNILSSIVGGGYDYMSGTSMSAPHVSGGAALLKQLHPDFTPAQIKSLLVNYADLLIDPSKDEYYSLLKQGAGRMNLSKSVNGSIVANPVSVSLLEIEKIDCAFDAPFTFDITNTGSKPETITLTGEPIHMKKVEFDFGESTLILNPLETKTIKAKFTLLADHFITEGYNEFIIRVTTDQNKDMHLSGIFYYGTQKKLDPVLLSFCFPTLAISPNSDGSADSNELFFLTPYMSDGIEVDLYDEKMETHLGVLNYGRERFGAGYFSTAFDGSVSGKSLSDGMYTAVPSLLPVKADYKDQKAWLKGKSVKLLIDTVPPKMNFTVEWDLLKEKLHIKGSISDDNSNFGLFCLYELDNDFSDLIAVKSDGSIDVTITPDFEYFVIKITAQDLAGNTFSIKKRL